MNTFPFPPGEYGSREIPMRSPRGYKPPAQVSSKWLELPPDNFTAAMKQHLASQRLPETTMQGVTLQQAARAGVL